ncbi:DUF58 domain-containing protein [Perlabentimonas gracilis]|uniref:DUF58 domain-containing protein n=1 Tax=Perlabentimonas gracilis TaxID=2715279 RepID=UPI001407A89F|nr:DUF58 domain-containing protein [Perlabentimonas gracilis]NHB68518.1 DUF58 domain-containing protein [Perlabentimonas gracilis]
MEASELLKRVRKIEIKTRGLSRQIFAGQYHSAFKGRGMAFSEVREYQYGDDIRNIDWNVTARFNQPFVKVFEEERELTVMLLIDVSGSRMFGTTNMLKKNLVTEISAVLAFSAIQNNDKIGVLMFSDKVEKFIPPKKGRTHILHIIRELINFTPTSQGTDLSEALRYLTNAIKKRCTAFVLSDFMDFKANTVEPNFLNALTIAGNKHDVVGVRVYDPREVELPPIGLVKMKDAESGQYSWVDTSSSMVRNAYAKWWRDTEGSLKQTFSRCKVDSVAIATNEDYVKPLIKLFKQRA